MVLLTGISPTTRTVPRTWQALDKYSLKELNPKLNNEVITKKLQHMDNGASNNDQKTIMRS